MIAAVFAHYFALLAGMPTEDNDQVLAAAKRVQEMGVDVVLAKLGTKGSMLIQKDEVLQQGIIKADKVSVTAVDPTPRTSPKPFTHPPIHPHTRCGRCLLGLHR